MGSEHHLLILSLVLYLLGGQVTGFTESRYISHLNSFHKVLRVKTAKTVLMTLFQTLSGTKQRATGSSIEGLWRRQDLRFQPPKQPVYTDNVFMLFVTPMWSLAVLPSREGATMVDDIQKVEYLTCQTQTAAVGLQG